MAPIHVLLVDDEQSFAEVLAQRLLNRGLKVTPVFNGPDALDRIEEDGTLDVLILDVAMPAMDGLETLQEIRKRRPLLETIMLTGRATLHSAVEAMKSGAFDYLMKPCDLEELLSKVKEAAERKRGREKQILEIRMKPYVSEREKEELTARILAS